MKWPLGLPRLPAAVKHGKPNIMMLATKCFSLSGRPAEKGLGLVLSIVNNKLFFFFPLSSFLATSFLHPARIQRDRRRLFCQTHPGRLRTGLVYELPFCGLVGAGEGRVAGLVMKAPTESRRVLFCFVFILRNPRLAEVFKRVLWYP